MASIFRQNAPARQSAAPTAFRNTLQPVGPGDVNYHRRMQQQRVSRTDLDFEEALRAEGTVVLKEGFDVNSLGIESPSSPEPSSRYGTPQRGMPSTPTVIPPTPLSGRSNGTSSAKSPSPSNPPSSNDPFSDSNDLDRQINRRSMYRSPGTSSSPDLATLLRKAKEKGSSINVQNAREKRRESPPPLPGPFDHSGRKRSSTSFSPDKPSAPVTPLFKGKNKQSDSQDWNMSGGSSFRENGSPVKVRGGHEIGRFPANSFSFSLRKTP